MRSARLPEISMVLNSSRETSWLSREAEGQPVMVWKLYTHGYGTLLTADDIPACR